MNVLVTAGAGFIGSHSVAALLEARAHVVVLDNFSARNRTNLALRARQRGYSARRSPLFR